MKSFTRPRFLTAMAACLVAGVAMSQKTYIVDKANGQGTHYTTLPAAIAAATHGDTLVVRTGTYKPANHSKGIAIVGQGAVVIQTTSFFNAGWLIKDLPAQTMFRMHNVTVEEVFVGTQPLGFANCNGTIHLDTVKILTRNVHPRNPHFSISNCKSATLRNVTSPTGLTVGSSNVEITGGFYQGTNGYVTWGHGCWRVPSNTGIIASDTILRVTEATVRGGDGHSGCNNQNPIAGSPAIRATSSTVTIAGHKTLVTGGSSSVYTLLGSNSVLVRDPFARITGKIEGFAARQEKLPILTATGGKIGQAINTELFVHKGQLWVFYESLPWTPLKVADFGNTLLHPNFLILLGVGVTSTDSRLMFKLPIPNDSGWRGIPILQQGFAGNFVDGFRYSNAVGMIMH